MVGRPMSLFLYFLDPPLLRRLSSDTLDIFAVTEIIVVHFYRESSNADAVLW